MPHSAHQKYIRNHKSGYRTALDKLVLVIAVVEPLFTLPQGYNVWIRHETAGVSLATWAFFTISAAIWLLYGLAIKNTPLIISSTLWTILQTVLVIGLLIY